MVGKVHRRNVITDNMETVKYFDEMLLQMATKGRQFFELDMTREDGELLLSMISIGII